MATVLYRIPEVGQTQTWPRHEGPFNHDTKVTLVIRQLRSCYWLILSVLKTNDFYSARAVCGSPLRPTATRYEALDTEQHHYKHDPNSSLKALQKSLYGDLFFYCCSLEHVREKRGEGATMCIKGFLRESYSKTVNSTFTSLLKHFL